MWAGVFVNERRTLTLWINEEDIASCDAVSYIISLFEMEC